MKGINYHLVTSVLLGFSIFLGIVLKWNTPVAWEFYILIYMLILFLISIPKTTENKTFYSIALIYLVVLVLFELLDEENLANYAGVFIFYGLFFGFLKEVVSQTRTIKK